MVITMFLATNPKVMGKFGNNFRLKFFGGMATGLMAAAVVVLFYTQATVHQAGIWRARRAVFFSPFDVAALDPCTMVRFVKACDAEVADKSKFDKHVPRSVLEFV